MAQVWLQVLVLVILSAFSHELELGDSCRTKSGKSGVCKLFEDCDVQLLFYEPDVVSCKQHSPILCCPMNTRIPIANQKCKEYRRNKPLRSTGTVVGGEDVESIDEFPHMALLGFGSGDNIAWLCGGTLISEKYVLTAAHCLSANNISVSRVQFGFLDKRNRNEYGTLQEYRVIHKHTPPNRSPLNRYNDIALLELETNVKFNSATYPACLQTEYEIKRPQATVVGWGVKQYKQQPADILQKVRLSLKKFEECKETYPTNRKLRSGIDYTSQICAGDLNKDACQGDSGGPLLIYDETGMPKIIGVTSFGYDCGKVPGVYTRVSHFVPWIESIIWA